MIWLFGASNVPKICRGSRFVYTFRLLVAYRGLSRMFWLHRASHLYRLFIIKSTVMKKISFLSAMLLVLVSAFAGDTPAYRPHGFHPGYHSVYGHGIHLRSLHRVHPGTVTRSHGASIPGAIQISMPDFIDADLSIDCQASFELTEVSLPDFTAADASIDRQAASDLTVISLPEFAASDKAMEMQATVDMTKISLPDFTEADAEIGADFGRES
jgi:hypothetical protein